MVLQFNANQKLKVLTILFIVFTILRNHLTPAKVRNDLYTHPINYVAKVKGILYFKEYKNCIIGTKFTATLLNVWILPISGFAS